jgi:hypothetical protein
VGEPANWQFGLSTNEPEFEIQPQALIQNHLWLVIPAEAGIHQLVVDTRFRLDSGVPQSHLNPTCVPRLMSVLPLSFEPIVDDYSPVQ